VQLRNPLQETVTFGDTTLRKKNLIFSISFFLEHSVCLLTIFKCLDRFKCLSTKKYQRLEGLAVQNKAEGFK